MLCARDRKNEHEKNVEVVMSDPIKDQSLPEYCVFKDVLTPGSTPPSILVQEADDFVFPLSVEDRESIETLIKKFDQEENCSGLAAPQIGVKKKAIVVAVEVTPEMQRWRPDLSQGMGKTVLLNPSYKAINPYDIHVDYESCFSIEGVAANVPRYKQIRYVAYDLNGNRVEGIAEGFLARVLQHEIDHVYGILYIHRTDKDEILPVEEYRQRRRAAMEQGRASALNPS